jgi:hypothetical protein
LGVGLQKLRASAPGNINPPPPPTCHRPAPCFMRQPLAPRYLFLSCLSHPQISRLTLLLAIPRPRPLLPPARYPRIHTPPPPPPPPRYLFALEDITLAALEESGIDFWWIDWQQARPPSLIRGWGCGRSSPPRAHTHSTRIRACVHIHTHVRARPPTHLTPWDESSTGTVQAKDVPPPFSPPAPPPLSPLPPPRVKARPAPVKTAFRTAR